MNKKNENKNFKIYQDVHYQNMPVFKFECGVSAF